MEISMWLVITWALLLFWCIYNIIVKRKLPERTEQPDQEHIGCASILLTGVLMLYAGLNLYYLAGSATLIGTGVFAVWSAFLAVLMLVQVGKAIQWFGMFARNEKLKPRSRLKILLWSFPKLLHLMYFGLFILTDVSLTNMITGRYIL